MEQFQIRPNKNAIKSRKRIGRGQGSGQGCTAGRGMNGQKSRSGNKLRPWFEGGQMPLQRRVPKRGFTNNFATKYQVLNLSDFENFADGAVVDRAALIENRKIRKNGGPVKILGDGEIKNKLTLKVDKVSKTAKEKLEKAGCIVELID